MLCYETYVSETPIKLEQNKRTRKFTVTYGVQVERNLSYDQACAELGYAIMHAAARDGKLDNRWSIKPERHGVKF
jgi:hypothetical protein